jgi:hypothetical protein
MRLRRQRPTQPTVSWDEMIPCPTCKEPRKVIKGPFPLANNLSSQGYYVICDNKNRCRQAELPPFFIQVLSDGRIPIMLPGEKQFDIPQLTPEQQTRLDEYYQHEYQRTLDKDELRKE